MRDRLDGEGLATVDAGVGVALSTLGVAIGSVRGSVGSVAAVDAIGAVGAVGADEGVLRGACGSAHAQASNSTMTPPRLMRRA